MTLSQSLHPSQSPESEEELPVPAKKSTARHGGKKASPPTDSGVKNKGLRHNAASRAGNPNNSESDNVAAVASNTVAAFICFGILFAIPWCNQYKVSYLRHYVQYLFAHIHLAICFVVHQCSVNLELPTRATLAVHVKTQ